MSLPGGLCMVAAGAPRVGDRGPHLTLGGTRAPRRPLAPVGLFDEKRNAPMATLL